MLPNDGLDEHHDGYQNVWLGVSSRIAGAAKVRFLSIEPLLEDLGEIDLTGIHWVIIGGDSGSGFRVMKKEWAESIIRQCREQDVAVFFKQWVGKPANAGHCIINGIEIKEWPVVPEIAQA